MYNNVRAFPSNPVLSKIKKQLQKITETVGTEKKK